MCDQSEKPFFEVCSNHLFNEVNKKSAITRTDLEPLLLLVLDHCADFDSSVFLNESFQKVSSRVDFTRFAIAIDYTRDDLRQAVSKKIQGLEEKYDQSLAIDPSALIQVVREAISPRCVCGSDGVATWPVTSDESGLDLNDPELEFDANWWVCHRCIQDRNGVDKCGHCDEAKVLSADLINECGECPAHSGTEAAINSFMEVEGDY